MSTDNLRLTKIGSGDFLFEPSRSFNVHDQSKHIEYIAARLLQDRAARLYYDLSGLALIDPIYYAWLDALARAVQTVNVKMICINMQPTAAFALSTFMHKKPAFETALKI